MDFEFSDDQEMLRDSVRRFLADQAPIAATCAPVLRRRPRARPRRVWDGLAELGVVGLLVPEEHGGAGMGMVDAAVVLEELGRARVPGARTSSSAIGAVSLVLGAGAASTRSSCPAWPTARRSARSRSSSPARATSGARRRPRPRADGDGWRLDGTKVHVADARGRDVVARHRARRRRRARRVRGADRRAASRVEPTPTVDGTRKQATVTLRRRAGLAARRPATRRAAVARTLDRLAVAHVVDGVGAAQRALELAVEYAKERVQFDKPIGSFQAVQHLCADMLRAVELGRAAGYYACWAADDADPRRRTAPRRWRRRSRADAFPQLGGTRDPGVRRHRLHVGARHPPVLQAAALAVAHRSAPPSDHLEELATIAID